jgi:hypothetical protein
VKAGRRWHVACTSTRLPMTDIVYIAIAAAFFGLTWAYARACDRL